MSDFKKQIQESGMSFTEGGSFTTEEKFGIINETPTKENSYLNLTLLSEEERKEVYKLCGFKNVLPRNMFVRYSMHFEIWGKYESSGNKTQVNFQEFKEIMGATETSEENNGWIKIESEKDLPKEKGHYLVFTKNLEIETIYADGNISESKHTAKNWMAHFTHIQKLKLPNPPTN